MNKDTFVWLAFGVGIGMLIAAAITYTSMIDDERRREDPRIRKAEALLGEAESLLKAAKKGSSVQPARP